MANTWVCCLKCTSSNTNGQFDPNPFWWNAQGQGQMSPGSNAPSGVAKNDNVYFAVQVDGGTGTVTVTDLRASFGRIPTSGGSVASPFLVNAGGGRMCSATNAIKLLNLTTGQTNPPGNNWYAVGPFTIVADPAFNGTSEYEFIVTAAVSTGNQFGIDPEMDVNNGT
jgi:hypothetical protein